jgi:putative endonuclease
MGHNTELGARGEQLAIDYLRSRGLRVLCRNWRCRFGEIDVVARDGKTTAFIEVKTRSGLNYGLPIEAVTEAKRKRIRQLAMMWLRHFGGPWAPIRFDVVSVLLEPDARPFVAHHRGVF